MIEPMIEPIFVILGILASVAIPRLAATREDAEISAAVANLRTLVSDASAYYVAKGDFAGAKWNDITNVPLASANGAATAVNAATNAVHNAATAHLKVGGKGCIGVHLVNKTATAPAHIRFTTPTNNDSVCQQVRSKAPVTAYTNSKVPNGNGQTIPNAIAIGSNTSIY